MCLTEAKKQTDATPQDRIEPDTFAWRRQPELLAASTPLRERPHDLEGQSADSVRIGMEGTENISSDKTSNTGKIVFSSEAQLILNTTPELNQGDEPQEVFTDDSNLLPRPFKANLLADELMVSQMSLDSGRLGQIQEQRRINAASLIAVAENGNSINDLSLFAELSSEEPNILTEMESASCLSPVGKELEGLIKENEELLDSK